MIKLTKIFTPATFAATFFAAASALAQENPPAIAFEDPATAPVTLWSDEGTLIIADDRTGLANSYNLMCPGAGAMRGIYSTDPNVAVMLVRYEDRAAVTDALANAYQAAARMLSDGQVDKPDPLRDYGLIAADGKVLSAPRHRDYIDLVEAFLEKPGELPGADVTRPESIRRLQSHAESFCFARY